MEGICFWNLFLKHFWSIRKLFKNFILITKGHAHGVEWGGEIGVKVEQINFLKVEAVACFNVDAIAVFSLRAFLSHLS
jgi:hypothetical protein